MSGIYIPGMDMPTSCCECCLAKLSPTGETLFCNYTLSTVPWDEKPFDCPLIPVPYHGRLIDADEFFKALTMDDRVSILEAMYVQSILSDAPTIIPADPAEEGEG